MSTWWTVYVGVRMFQGTLCFIFNCFTIFAVVRFKFLRSAANILVVSLAASDLLHGCVVSVILPIRTFFIESRTVDNFLCHSQLRIELIGVAIQYTMFISVAIERWSSLRAEIGNGEKWHHKKALIVAIATWAFGLAWAILMAIMAENPEEQDQCLLLYFIQKYFVFAVIIYFIITAIVTSLFYGWVARIILKSHGRIAPDNLGIPNSSQINKRKVEIQISKMMGMVVGLYFILYLPFAIITLTMSPDSSVIHSLIKYICILIYDVNFWINPIIYVWRDRKFQKAFKKIFKKMPCFKGQQMVVSPYRDQVFSLRVDNGLLHSLGNAVTLSMRLQRNASNRDPPSGSRYCSGKGQGGGTQGSVQSGTSRGK